MSTFKWPNFRGAYITTQKKLFKLLKQTVNKSNSKEFLNQILSESGLYRGILDKSFRSWSKQEERLKESMKALLLFNVKQQIPMLLSVMREYERGNLKLKRVKDIVRAIECFHFIFTAVTSQRSSGGISFMYAYHARQLDQAIEGEKTRALDELKIKLRDKLPSKDEFLASFAELHFSSVYSKERALIKYILTQYDSFYAAKEGSGTIIKYELMTIEHMSSENDSSSKINLIDLGKIGNLILIDEKLNGDLGNKPFAVKYPIYLKSGTYLDEKVRKARNWDEETILERTHFIGQRLYEEVFKF